MSLDAIVLFVVLIGSWVGQVAGARWEDAILEDSEKKGYLSLFGLLTLVCFVGGLFLL